MRSRLMPTLIAILAAMVLVAASVGALAEQLGNDPTQRSYGADLWTASNFTMIDISPLDHYLAMPGYVTAWNYYVDGAIQTGTTSNIDLEVWRPTGNSNQYELVIRQAATLGGSGLQTVAPTGSTLTTLVNPGDFLGFYVHQGQHPLISLDFKGTPSVTDPFLVPGGGSVQVGQVYTFSSGNGSRSYSLGVDTRAVPEPMTVVLGILGLVPIAGFQRLRRK